MKFTKEDYEQLKFSIQNLCLDLEATIAHYKENKIGNDPEVRVMWDIFWTVNQDSRGFDLANRPMYSDTHIFTAVKKAVYELIKEEATSTTPA